MSYKGYTMKLSSYDIPLDMLIFLLQRENEKLRDFSDDENEAVELIKEYAIGHADSSR